jgi:hypothetical protein
MNRNCLIRQAVRYAIAVAAASSALPVFAQDATPDPKLEEITVVGTRIVRKDYEATSPVVTVSEDTFKLTVRRNGKDEEVFDNLSVKKGKGVLSFYAGDKLITRCTTWEHHSSADSVLDVGGSLKATVAQDTVNETAGAETRKAGKNMTHKAGGNIEQTAGACHNVTAGKNADVKAGQDVSLKAGKSFKGTAGMSWTQSAGLAMTLNAAVDIAVSALGMLDLQAMGMATLMAAKAVMVKGGLVKIN